MDARTLARFMAKVDKTDECWLWTGCKRHGYGLIRTGGQMLGVHRLSYLHHHGEIQEGLVVRHKCKNRHCVNPEHLEVGTQQDNMNDRVRDGTDQYGEKNHEAKLTDDQVLEIRNRVNEAQVNLAREFGVSKSLIGSIIRREHWKHI